MFKSYGHLSSVLKIRFLQLFPVMIESQFREPETAQNKNLLDRVDNAEIDETTLKSIDTSRPSDFQFNAIKSERAYREMIAEETVEPVEVVKEEPKEFVDFDSDESRPGSGEPKEVEKRDDLSDDYQPEGKLSL